MMEKFTSLPPMMVIKWISLEVVAGQRRRNDDKKDKMTKPQLQPEQVKASLKPIVITKIKLFANNITQGMFKWWPRNWHCAKVKQWKSEIFAKAEKTLFHTCSLRSPISNNGNHYLSLLGIIMYQRLILIYGNHLFPKPQACHIS